MLDKTFLFDEVRCGYLVPTAVKQAWAAELEVLQEIDRICAKHNISYFADWGTLLGTVRHGGFVPWDDDLDIIMKRDDLKRFLEVAPREFSEDFHIQNFRNQPDYWLFIYKVVGRNHICFEKDHLRKFYNFPYMACIDIFVLDYVHRDPEKEENRRKICKSIMAVADSIVEGKASDEAEIKNYLRYLENLGGYPKNSLKFYPDPVEMGRYLYNLMEERFMEVEEKDSDYLVQLFPQGLRHGRRHYPKAYYDNPIRLPFEYTTIPVPRNYDSMLEKRYGIYAGFKKDGGGHDYPYFEGQKRNLLQVLDFDYPEFRTTDEIMTLVSDRSNRGDAGEVTGGYKAMLVEALLELGRLQQYVDNLPDAQQLAVDIGNLIEYVWNPEHEAISVLERYCEAVYALYEKAVSDPEANLNVLTESVVNIYDELIDTVQKTILTRKTAVFMPVRYEEWSSMKNMWDELAKDTEWTLYLWPLTYYFKDYDSSPIETICEREAWEMEYGEYLIPTEKMNSEFLEALHADRIVIQNPYDEWNPNISVSPDLYSRNLINMTDDLVYIMPHIISDFMDLNGREYSNMKYYATMPGVVYSDRTFVCSEVIRKRYIDRLAEFAGEDSRDIWEKKIVFDKNIISNSLTECSKEGRKKKLVYGIGAGFALEHSDICAEKLTRVLEYLKQQTDIVVSVSIYPSEIDEFERLIPSELLTDYETVDGTGAAEGFDAYYGDVLPITAEFISAGKPVMIQNWSV